MKYQISVTSKASTCCPCYLNLRKTLSLK